jgi:hypothetical protein
VKFRLILGAFLITLCIGGSAIFARGKTGSTTDLIKPSIVFAQTQNNCCVYENKNGTAVDFLRDGTKVEVIKDNGTKWYYIRYGSSLGWVKSESLIIEEDEKAEKKQLSKQILESYANNRFEKYKGYFVWVDISRQRTYIFQGDGESWKLQKQLICSTGKNISPTLRGFFTINGRGDWFYSDRLENGAKYWVRYKDSYLFHSVAMDKNKNIIDDTLGEKSSHGCVRLSVEDAKWFYENIRDGSKVFIN